jgi:3-keto-5-aminohexanoate cleavage enzyme
VVRELPNGRWEIEWEERLNGLHGDGVEMCTLDAQAVVASFGGKEILVATPASRIRQIAEMMNSRGIKPNGKCSAWPTSFRTRNARSTNV